MTTATSLLVDFKNANGIQISNSDADAQEDSESNGSCFETFNQEYVYVLGSQDSMRKFTHPPANLIRRLWHAFVHNVHPLTKLVHIPSLERHLETFIVKMENLPRDFEALLYSIYSIAVVSLHDNDCKDMLGEGRETALQRYVAATRVALSRANFMSTTNLVVVQALVLHILSVRDIYEPRAVWALTGLALRVTEGLGMHIDGSLIGLTPFESEIRRRVWWQLKMHDSRTAELSGQAKFQDWTFAETTPKKPANINDIDMYPAMKEAPAESTRPTESIWIVLRAEFASFAADQKAKLQKLGRPGSAFSEDYAAIDNLKAKDDFIAGLEDLIETKYLKLCDPTVPLQFLVLLGARAALDIIRFTAHHPRRWKNMEQVPTSEQQLVWEASLKLLERYNLLQTSPQLREFAWNVPYFVQWHAVIHILDTLQTDPTHRDAPRVWEMMDVLYNMNVDLLLNTKRPIFVAVGNLCLKAFNARKAKLANTGQDFVYTPSCITKLQAKKEKARAKRAVLTNPDRKENKSNPNHGNEGTNSVSAMDNVAGQPQQEITAPAQSDMWLGIHASWPENTADDALRAYDTAGPMNLDLDSLREDPWAETPGDASVDWAQWDAWIANVDMMHYNIAAGQS